MNIWKLPCLLALCLCLTACGGDLPAEGRVPDEAETPIAEEAPKAQTVTLDPDEEPTVTVFRIVDGAEDGNLLLAKLCKCAGADVCRLPVEGVPVTLDGKAADPSVLEDGMTVEVAFNGETLETFPAQLGEVYSLAAWSAGTEKNPGGTCYDLCGLYLQVLDDLWNKDPGLNDDISIAGLDLSRAPGGLTESEKAALAWRFGEMHGVEVVTGTFEELREQGYFQEKVLQYTDGGAQQKETAAGPTFYEWEDGCLFSIQPNEGHAEEVYSLPALFFNAEKWRSPLGAYGFYDCRAVWPEWGTWSGYQILGGEMIS